LICPDLHYRPLPWVSRPRLEDPCDLAADKDYHSRESLKEFVGAP